MLENKEYVDRSARNNSKKGDVLGCGFEDTEDNKCGCGYNEYADASLLDNPDRPEFIASSNFIEEFEKYAHSLGVKSTGYARLAPELMIKDKFIQYPNAIVLTMEMDEKILETAPCAEAQRLNDLFYKKFGDITYRLSDYLRQNGFATEVAHPLEGIVNFSLLGQYAGLGFIGKSGLLITPELGPRLKISAIFVSIANLPVYDKENNEHSWIPDYCDKCGKCVKACPEKALIQTESCCGDKEIKFIQELCIGCSQGCTYCINGCPFDQKGYDTIKNRFEKMKAKLMNKC